MYKNKKKNKERCVLSDLLPYESPLIFTNRYFYRFLILNNISYNIFTDVVSWKFRDDITDKLILIMLGVHPNEKLKMIKDRKEIILNKKSKHGIPFNFKISHNENKFRELSIAHPKNQLQSIDFYDKFKEQILYYCSLSLFSIRYPDKIAKYVYFRDSTHYLNLNKNELEIIEESEFETENIRSYFTYKNFSNIYKFYNSYKYLRCEKKYNYLMKVDIATCFDSIYTHSIAWAILGKEQVKENIGEGLNKTFAGIFDNLMQRINYNETNGIVIGPELSRIFSELILQSIDKSLYNTLLGGNIFHKIDYEIFRYVDDYFIFYNDDATKNLIERFMQLELKKYKLSINTEKTIIYEKPIITEITRAKERIVKLLSEYILIPDIVKSDEDNSKQWGMNLNSRTLIVNFKIILKESSVTYKDIMNYSLHILESKSKKIVESYQKSSRDLKSPRRITSISLGILEFVFFIYSVSPKVSSTIRLCRILRVFIDFFKQDNIFSNDQRNIIYRFLYDEISLLLRKNKCDVHTQIETLYLIIILKELGKEYLLTEKSLANYFCIENHGRFDGGEELNYFSITVLLFYIRQKKCYYNLKKYIEKIIFDKFNKMKLNLKNSSEFTILFFDIISCPYIDISLKNQLLEIYGIKNSADKKSIIKKCRSTQSLRFTTWENFSFGKELDFKQAQDVY